MIALDDYVASVSCHRVYRKHYSCGFGVHHFLNPNAYEDFLMSKAFFITVEDCPRREEAGPAFDDVFKKFINSSDVQKGFLLTGERRVGEVFGCGAWSHSNTNVLQIAS